MKSLAAFCLAAARTFLTAWILRDLWTWFIVPLGPPAISYWHAYGIDITVRFLFIFVSRGMPDRTGDEPLAYETGSWVVRLMAWGFGWLAHAAMVGVLAL